jgi:hypothetical protein
MVKSPHAYLESLMEFLEAYLSLLSEKLNHLSTVRVAEAE